ncbi:MAG TPA: hypothetical protein VNO35_28665 [Steroidobacteraceae bacterium]|nr:hypothetical protein [Steroidobacteraceae bacterium]
MNSMNDVTESLWEYLEAKRHLWNIHFRGKVDSLQHCPILDEFEKIDRSLFRALVVEDIVNSDDASRRRLIEKPWELLRVYLQPGLESIRMIVSDPISGLNRSWNRPEILKVPEEFDFGFIEFFEWNRYGYTNFPLIRVTVDHRSKMPALSGREALIESGQARFVLLATHSESLPIATM